MSASDLLWKYSYAQSSEQEAVEALEKARATTREAEAAVIAVLRSLPFGTALESGHTVYWLRSNGDIGEMKTISAWGYFPPMAAPVIDACGCDDHETERHLAESFVLPDATEAAIDEANANF